jgi:hypothetical protein
MEDNVGILNVDISENTFWIIFKYKPNFINPQNEDDLQWKTTSNGRQSPMEDDTQWKTTFNGRQPQMEDNLQ